MTFPFQDCEKWSQNRVTESARGVDSSVKKVHETLMSSLVLGFLHMVFAKDTG